VVDAAARLCADRTAAVLSQRPLFVALADEASVTRHANPLDFCWSPKSLVAFRAFLHKRHRDLAALNRAWGTSFACWDDVLPMSTDQIRRRELGDALLPANLRPWSEHREFMDSVFAAAVAQITAQVRSHDASLPVGLTGMPAPAAFGGHDYAHLPQMTLVEAYDQGGAPALLRSLLPGAMQVATLAPLPQGAPSGLVAGQLADWLAHGTAAVVVWNAAGVLDKERQPTQFGRLVSAAFATLAAPAEFCAGARVEPGAVWIVESQPSVRAWWMLDSATDGATWLRRLSSYEAAHSTSQAARASWVQLLRDLGLQPRFVAEDDLCERLLREQPRCLVLAAAIALSERTCRAVAAYVQAGGTLLADHTPGLYDEHLVRRAEGPLDEVFGVQRRSLRWDDLLVRQGEGQERVRLASGARVAEAGLHGATSERQGEHQVFLERQHGRGRAVYLNLAVCDYDRIRLQAGAISAALDLRTRVRQVMMTASVEPPFEVRGNGLPTCLERVVLRCAGDRRVLVARVNALQNPAVLQAMAQRGPLAVTVSLPQAVRLRVLGRSEVLGPADRFELSLDPWTGLFLEQLGR
jgi:hypothetical protein